MLLRAEATEGTPNPDLEPKRAVDTAGGHQSIDCSSLPGLKRPALPADRTSAPVRGLHPIRSYAGVRSIRQSPQLNAIARAPASVSWCRRRFLRPLRFGLGDAGFGHHFVDDVELDHADSRWGSDDCFKLLMLWEITEIVNGSIIPVN